MDLNPDNLRTRFAELGEQREASLAISGPLRDQRDTIARDAEASMAALDARIRAAEDGLFDIDQQRAMISRALGGKTGTTEA